MLVHGGAGGEDCRVTRLLLDYLQSGVAAAWPGCDGMTADDVLLSYPAAALAGLVPDLRGLIGLHPDLAADLAAYFTMHFTRALAEKAAGSKMDGLARDGKKA
jgi:hypothetical protein